jgi:hypothetical protein
LSRYSGDSADEFYLIAAVQLLRDFYTTRRIISGRQVRERVRCAQIRGGPAYAGHGEVSGALKISLRRGIHNAAFNKFGCPLRDT